MRVWEDIQLTAGIIIWLLLFYGTWIATAFSAGLVGILLGFVPAFLLATAVTIGLAIAALIVAAPFKLIAALLR